MELSSLQEDIVNTSADKAVVIAAAASGKTRTLVARVLHLLKSGADPKKIVLLTFTNAAAEELSERLHRPTGLFCGTIHSYANYLLLSKGNDTSGALEEEDFDRLFQMIKASPECVRPIDYLLLDEAQDSTPLQFEFLLDILKPKSWMLVGDFRQSIYRWAGADPQYLIDLTQRTDVVTYDLNENYRNGRSILTFAQSIIQLAGYEYLDTSRSMRPIDGRVCTMDYNGGELARQIKAWGDYKNWFILTRTNDQADEISRLLKQIGVPCDSFKRSQLDSKELFQRLQNDTVKVLTIHTSKGLEAKNVAVIGARFYNIEEKCISYVAATRAKDLLVWTKMPSRKKRAAQVTRWDD